MGKTDEEDAGMEFVKIEEMTVEELREYLAALRERIAELDEQEPEDM